MKKKLFVLLCAGMILTGCAGQKADDQEEPEVISLDFGGNIQENETTEEQVNPISSDMNETMQSGERAKQQEPEAEISKESDIDTAQNNENTQDLYMQFLNNQISAIVRDNDLQDEYRIYYLEDGKSYSFAEIGQTVNQSYFDPEYSQKTSYDYAQYTYVDCPDSDSRNLLIKFVGLNIYSQGDDSFAVYVITEDHGQLYLTGGYECWARSYTEQYRNGLCVNGGSAGAGDHYSGISAILSNGNITDIYVAETLSGWWTSHVNDAIYNEVFDGAEEIPFNVSIYTIGEETYYTYDLSECTDEQVTVCETYINRCRDEAKINWSSDEEVENAAQKRCSAIGVNYDTLDQLEEAEWADI